MIITHMVTVCSSCRKRHDIAVNNQQLVELERWFSRQKYVSPADVNNIASSLELNQSQVVQWFINRRRSNRDARRLPVCPRRDPDQGLSLKSGLTVDLQPLYR